MTNQLLGFIRGILYPIVGGIFWGISFYITHNAAISTPIAGAITGVIGMIDHKYNLPMPPTSTS